MTLGLELAEFGEGAAQDVVGLGSGPVYRLLLFCGFVLIAGVAREVEFEDAAAAETPGGPHDLGGEGLFEDASGRKFGHEG